MGSTRLEELEMLGEEGTEGCDWVLREEDAKVSDYWILREEGSVCRTDSWMWEEEGV